MLHSLPEWAYLAPLRCRIGYGDACRDQLQVLSDLGWRLRPYWMSTRQDSPEYQALGKEQSRRGLPELGGSLMHATPEHAISVASTKYSRAELPPPHVLVTAWETTRLPDLWVEYLQDFSAIWCPTQWQAGIFKDSGVTTPIHTVPFAMAAPPKPQGKPLCRQRYNFAPDKCYYLAIGDWGPRKALAELIGTFKQAQLRNSVLVLKVPAEQSDHFQALALSAGLTSDKVMILAKPLLSSDMQVLYEAADVLVSLTRGEGWNYPAMQAMFLGTPVVSTGFGALGEWGVGGFLRVAHDLAPIPPGAQHELGPGSWGEPRWVEAALALQSLQTPESRAMLARRGSQVAQGLADVTRVGRAVLTALK